jgi:nucleotide-binding universal stress UspA family protein
VPLDKSETAEEGLPLVAGLEAEAFGADLIAVTTTGRSGLRRAVLGSVAEQVFNRSRVPVMLYHNNAPGH